MSQSPAYVVLCVLAHLAKISQRQVCLGGKFLCCVNASAPASMWMVRYAISSTPFWWHVQCDCPALLSIVMWHWHPLWFGNLLNLPAPFVMMLLPCRCCMVTRYLLIPFLNFLGLTWLFPQMSLMYLSERRYLARCNSNRICHLGAILIAFAAYLCG